MKARSWTGIPARLPRRLPPPIPELAFLIRIVLEHLGIPSSSRRDYIFNYLRHVSILRRLPAKRLLFNDVVFHIKTGGTLRSPKAIAVSDKELLKHHIAKVLGEQYIIPTLAVLKTPEEIDAFEFPDRCIIKPTHACGSIILRKSGEPIDRDIIKSWLTLSYYDQSYEANYKTLVPKVIVEPWVFGHKETTEFKFYCVAGKARMAFAIGDRFGKRSIVAYDLDWNEYYYALQDSPFDRKSEKPKKFAEMLSIAESLSQDFFLVRIDLYSDDETIKCGEITTCPNGGFESYEPLEGELKLARLVFADVPDEACDKFFAEA